MMATAPSTYDEILTRSFSVDSCPECPICSERYDDQDSDLIPRNLACGHSMCSSEFWYAKDSKFPYPWSWSIRFSVR